MVQANLNSGTTYRGRMSWLLRPAETDRPPSLVVWSGNAASKYAGLCIDRSELPTGLLCTTVLEVCWQASLGGGRQVSKQRAALCVKPNNLCHFGICLLSGSDRARHAQRSLRQRPFQADML
ncbi:hypothetical protein AC579_455 [Pseudocercospora musae]|uniref:Uncharacterized protein n=1 Tax=Pseudocercospora musae TaxID=113226 RepID=A0A139HT59_9PEZI|nr:hypothetical protein AC579_455 [Pseudocercospora musae]